MRDAIFRTAAVAGVLLFLYWVLGWVVIVLGHPPTPEAQQYGFIVGILWLTPFMVRCLYSRIQKEEF